MDGIDIVGLTKTYAGAAVPALDRLSLRVGRGEVYGFLGANGAGKSTTIRLLLNFIQPTSGRARIVGRDCVAEATTVKKHVGYLAGDVALWPRVTGNELFAYLSKLSSQTKTEYLTDLIRRFAAEPDKRIDQLSKGNRQKIGIIQALMHQPDVLILDEPTSGLDPLMQEVFYDCVREAAGRGTAVFVSSHNLAETQRMCDRVGIIKHGQLIHEQAIKEDAGFDVPIFCVALKDAQQVKRLKQHTRMKIVAVDGLVITVQPKSSIASALKELSAYDITGLTTRQLNLEDEFLEYYGDGV